MKTRPFTTASLENIFTANILIISKVNMLTNSDKIMTFDYLTCKRVNKKLIDNLKCVWF